MFKINNGTHKIILTKGDTASILVQVYDEDNKEYQIKTSDVITMTIKKTANSEPVLIKYTDVNNYITLFPEDTDNIPEGLYVYDIQLKTVDDYIYTIVPTSFLELATEVSQQ